MKHFSVTISLIHRVKYSSLRIEIPKIDCDFSLMKTKDGRDRFDCEKFQSYIVFNQYYNPYFDGCNLRIRQEGNNIVLGIRKAESDIYIGFILSMLLEFDKFIDGFKKSKDENPVTITSNKGYDFVFTKSKDVEELSNLLIKGIENSSLKRAIKEGNMK